MVHFTTIIPHLPIKSQFVSIGDRAKIITKLSRIFKSESFDINIITNNKNTFDIKIFFLKFLKLAERIDLNQSINKSH